MQVELNLGSGFIDIGTQQLLSVPYALYAGSVTLDVSSIGDTLFVSDGSFVIIPGISEANNTSGDGTTTGTTLHTCGAPNVHNPNLTYGSMTDQEGNVYKTIVIGNQEWMAENLNTSIYRNGDVIATGLSDADWQNTTNTQQGAWAFYNNDASYACPYGKLYNWYACSDARQLCPLDWHVPSDEEWGVLTSYLGSVGAAPGGAMKTTGTIESGTEYWYTPNEGATNSSGFSGVPGGARFEEYAVLGYDGYWWLSSEVDSNLASIWYMFFAFEFADQDFNNKRNGFSVRCLRD
jgi:uncharacterized protein (TIGR02145 family)